MEELSELANENVGELPVLENCTGFYIFSPSGLDSQNWHYCGKDAAAQVHRPPGWNISTTFLRSILYP